MGIRLEGNGFHKKWIMTVEEPVNCNNCNKQLVYGYNCQETDRIFCKYCDTILQAKMCIARINLLRPSKVYQHGHNKVYIEVKA